MKPPIPSRYVRAASTTSFVLAAAFALFACAGSSAAGAAEVRLARLSEKTFPAAEMPPTATPTPAAPSAAAPGGGAAAAPSATASPPAETGYGQSAPETTVAPAEAGPAPEGAAGVGSEQPASSDTSDVAPLGIGAVNPQLQVSDRPLAATIREASTPSMAASLRIVDHARENILGGRPGDAIQELAHALSIDPADAYAYFYLGRAWLAKRDYTQAMTFLKRAEIGFGSNPEWLGETLAFEGLTYEESGQLDAARTAYQTAMDAEPGSLMARVGYTRLGPQSAPTPAVGEPNGASGEPGPSSDWELVPPPQEAPAPPPASEPAPVN
jgi:TolA-binding protein